MLAASGGFLATPAAEGVLDEGASARGPRAAVALAVALGATVDVAGALGPPHATRPSAASDELVMKRRRSVRRTMVLVPAMVRCACVHAERAVTR